MALVNDQEVVLIDGRSFRCIPAIENPADKALNSADVDRGLGIWSDAGQSLQAKDFRKGFPGNDLRCRELPLGLVAECAPVHHETDAAKSLGRKQPVEKGDC